MPTDAISSRRYFVSGMSAFSIGGEGEGTGGGGGRYGIRVSSEISFRTEANAETAAARSAFSRIPHRHAAITSGGLGAIVICN